MPGMQPAKPCAASKMAAFASVSCSAQVSSWAGTRSRVREPPALLQQLDRPLRPTRPLTQQPADDPQPHLAASGRDAELRQQIEQDVIVVAGVERDVPGAPGFGHGADDLEGLVTVERRNLDGHDVRDLHEAPPEWIRQQPAPGRGLQIEADERDFPGDGPAMRDQLGVRASRSAPSDSRPAW